jgi:hypothetical protein
MVASAFVDKPAKLRKIPLPVKILAPVLAVLGCDKGASTKQSPTGSAAAAGSASVAARRALAQKLSAGEFVSRTAGADDTVLEFTSKVHGCKLENLMPIVNKSGQTMANLGFTKLRCMDSGEYVDLDSAAPALAASNPAKPLVADTAAVEVTAGELYEEYMANAIGADAKYRDKVLRVTGVVDRVGKEHDEKPFVVFMVLEAGDGGLRASFSTATGLAELRRFQAVAARCRGGSSAGLPTLSGCVFESVVDEEPGSGYGSAGSSAQHLPRRPRD